MDRQDWDARYAAREAPLFGVEPNDHLRAVCARPELSPADALSLADGDGRNGRWLARRGLAVTAVDYSTEANRRARAADAAEGLTVERIEADLTEWTPPQGRRFGLVALFYLQGPASLRMAALRLAAASVAPGGWLAMEGFAADGPETLTLGPSTQAARWRAEEIAAELDGFAIHELLTGRILLREGPSHDGSAWAVRLLARLRA
jgi:SAM-dependent methyltransferase